MGFNHGSGLNIVPGHYNKGAFESTRVRNGEVFGFHLNTIHPDDVEIQGAIAPSFVTLTAVILFNAIELSE